MSAYTDAELLAVARVVWVGGRPPTGLTRDEWLLSYANLALQPSTRTDFRLMPSHWYKLDEFAVLLALAHPERAGEALGPGWSASFACLSWEDREGREYRRAVSVRRLKYVGPGRPMVAVPAYVTAYIPPILTDEELPPEFDAALSRARLIAAAWQRIEEAK